MAAAQGRTRLQTEKAQEEKRAAQRLKALTAVLLILTVIFVALSLSSPEGKVWLSYWQAYRAEKEGEQRFRFALQKDPYVGTPMSQLVKVPMLRAIGAMEEPTLVVVFDRRCSDGGAKVLPCP